MSQFWSLGEAPLLASTFQIAPATAGYHGPGCDKPRKYIRGELRSAFAHPPGLRKGDEEYHLACQSIGAEPNSKVDAMLKGGVGGVALESSKFLGGEWVSLRDTYVGERGFIALLPLLDRNTTWTSLDASSNGLRNEAVLHLADLMLRPPHTGRVLHLDLSGNPISDTAGKTILEVARTHPHIGHIALNQTKISRRLLLQIRQMLELRHMNTAVICYNCGNFFLADSRFCRHCGMSRRSNAHSDLDCDDGAPRTDTKASVKLESSSDDGVVEERRLPSKSFEAPEIPS